MTCTTCGQVLEVLTEGYTSYSYNKLDYLKNKDKYSRSKWFQTTLMKLEISSKYHQELINDFIKVIRCLENLGFTENKKIVTHSGFYVRRLCSKLNIPLPVNEKYGEPKGPLTLPKLENRLFGMVYAVLFFLFF